MKSKVLLLPALGFAALAAVFGSSRLSSRGVSAHPSAAVDFAQEVPGDGGASPPPTAAHDPLSLAADERFPFGEAPFTGFVADSYRIHGTGDPNGFYRWIETAFRSYESDKSGKAEATDLTRYLEEKTAHLDKTSNSAQRAQAELQLAAELHRMVKAVIPRFSLGRGFEFANVVKLGERQCFLQSVLIAGPGSFH